MLCSLHCRRSILVKEGKNIFCLDGYKAASKQRVSAEQYVGTNLDQLLPREESFEQGMPVKR